jgi:peptidoglycan-associated lipoprotein
MALGQRRAQETKKYLVNLGIKESTITTISYGEERPLDPESNEEAWAKNRRAHFLITR